MPYIDNNSKLISDCVPTNKFRQLLFSEHKVTVVVTRHVILSANASTFINDCAWIFSLHCLCLCNAVGMEVEMKMVFAPNILDCVFGRLSVIGLYVYNIYK